MAPSFSPLPVSCPFPSLFCSISVPPSSWSPSFLALTTAFPPCRFQAFWFLWGAPPDAGPCRADPGGSFPWDPLPSAAREGAAGWPSGRRCPPGVSPELTLAPPGWRIQGEGVRPWMSHLSTPWEGRQGLGRERSPKWPTLSAETAGLLASSIGPLCDLHRALCLLCPHFSFVQCH